MSQVAEQAIIEINAQMDGLRSDFNKAFREVQKFQKKSEKSFDKIGDSVTTLRRAFVALGGALTVRQIVNASIEFERLSNKMVASAGNAEVARAGMMFVREEAERLGIEFTTAADGFAGFSASALRAGLTFGDTKQIFSDMSAAIVSLNLDPQRAGLIFRALEQMASKSTVQMEELKLQLGDSLPGALEIAARSMDVTTQEFIKMVESGEVLARDFLPSFAKEIKHQLGRNVSEAAQSAQAKINRMKNAFFDLKVAVANGGFMDKFTESIEELAEVLSNPELQEGLASLASALGDVAIFAVKASAGLGNVIKNISDTVDNVGNKTGDFLFSAIWGDEGLEALDKARAEKLGTKVANTAQEAQKIAEEKINEMQQNGDMGSLDDFTLGTGKVKEGFSALGIDKGQMKEELQELQDSLMTKEELEIADNERRLSRIQSFLDAEVNMKQEQRDILLALEQGYEEQQTKIKARHDNDRLKIEKKYSQEVDKLRQMNTDNALSLLKGLVGENKGAALAILAIEKGLAISRMLINTEVAAMRALSDLGPIAGAPVAAAIRTQGAISAGLIAAQGLIEGASTLSGGGGSSATSLTGSTSAVAVREVDDFGTPIETGQGQDVNITVQGNIFDESTIRDIIEGINQAVRNNVTVDFAG